MARVVIGASSPERAPVSARQSVAYVGLATATAALLLPLPAAAVTITLAAYGAVGGLTLAGLARHHPHASFGLANLLTLLRAGGAAIFLGLAAAPHLIAGPAAWGVVAAAIVTLALDGVDGWAARRQGLASAFGARLDMETDALTILALAALAFATGKAGAWVLAIGAMRYAFVAATLVWPRLGRPLPPSVRRKAICVAQLVALTVLAAPAIAPPASTLVAAAALAALALSFALDIGWLLRSRR